MRVEDQKKQATKHGAALEREDADRIKWFGLGPDLTHYLLTGHNMR